MIRFLRPQAGSTLLVVVFLLMFVAVVVSAGVSLIAPMVKHGRINDSKTRLNSDVDAILSWSVANKRIPKNSEYQAVLASPNDAWGKQIIYLYDSKLADPTAAGYGGICGLNTTTTYNGQQIAFVLVSGGDDMGIESTPNATQPFAGAPTLQLSDLVRVVPLDELQSRAGCSGSSPGGLRIVNNEIPNGCSGKYKVTLYADGGVPSSYAWQLVSATATTPPPVWTPAPQAQSGAFAVFSSSTTPLGASNTITFQLADGQTTVQRTYNLKTVSCGCAGYRVWSNSGVDNDYLLSGIVIPCKGNISSGSEITNGTPELVAGQTLTRYTKAGNCKVGWNLDQVTYAQAVLADTNGNCQVRYNAGGTVTDR
jgi:hypothetical protein